MDATLERYLERNNIQLSWYLDQAASSRINRRFARVCKDDVDTSSLVGAEWVDWLPNFISLPASMKLKGLDLFEQGSIFGIDAASGFVVRALAPSPGEAVLDLCCAPGGKLCMMAELMNHRGTLIGVDASLDRMRTCSKLCRKYKVPCTDSHWDFVLAVVDGTKFFNPYALDSRIIWDSVSESMLSSFSKQRRVNKSLRCRINKAQEFLRANRCHEEFSFDKVLVDAECTHDGSLKHMEKYAPGGVFDGAHFPDTCNYFESIELQKLQRALILNGFKLLRPGGFMIYSTCSFCVAQNEAIVSWLLKNEKDASLVSLSEVSFTQHPVPLCKSTVLPGTIRFEPRLSRTSGLFVAKISKLSVV